MTLAKHLRSNLRGLRPLYAALGATDLAVERLRELGAKASGELEPVADSQGGADGNGRKGRKETDVDRLLLGARQVPGLVVDQAVSAVTRTQEQYDGLAARGARLARRAPEVGEEGVEAATSASRHGIRRAGDTVSRGRRVAGTAAARTRSAAGTTLRTARSEADQVLEAVAHAGRQSGPTGVVGGHTGPNAAPGATRPVPRRRRTASTNPNRPADATTPHHSAVPAGSAVEAGSTARRAKKAAPGTTPAKKAPSAKRAPARQTPAKPTPAASAPAAGPTPAPAAPTSTGPDSTGPAAAGPPRRRPPRRATSTAESRANGASTPFTAVPPSAPSE